MATQAELEQALRNASIMAKEGDPQAAKDAEQIANELYRMNSNHAPLTSIKGQGEALGRKVDDAIDYTVDAAKNYPGSAWQLVKDTVNAVTSPIETASNLGTVLKGVVQKYHPDYYGDKTGENRSNAIKAAELAGEYYKDKYWFDEQGNWNLPDTFREDPAGTLSDVSVFGVLNKMSKLSKLPKLSSLSKLSHLDKLNALDLPNNLMNATITKALNPLNEKGIYQSAVKFSSRNALPKKMRNEITDVALNKGITPDDLGIAKLQASVKNLTSQLDEIIKNSGSKGVPVSGIRAIVREGRKQFEGFVHGGEKNRKLFDKEVAKFDDIVGDRQFITPQEALQYKRSIDKQINYDILQKTKQPRRVAQDSLRRGAKEGLESIDENINPTNQQLSKELALLEELPKSAGRIENKNRFFNLPTSVAISNMPLNPLGSIALSKTISLLSDDMNAAKFAIALRQGKNLPVIKQLLDLEYKGLLDAAREAEQVKNYEQSLLNY